MLKSLIFQRSKLDKMVSSEFFVHFFCGAINDKRTNFIYRISIFNIIQFIVQLNTMKVYSIEVFNIYFFCFQIFSEPLVVKHFDSKFMTNECIYPIKCDLYL